MTRPAVAKQIQQILLRMAQQGQLRGRVSDDQLVGLLEQVRSPVPPQASRVALLALTLCSLYLARQAQAANSGSTSGAGKISVRSHKPLSVPSDVPALTYSHLPRNSARSSSARAESTFSALSTCRANTPCCPRWFLLTLALAPFSPLRLSFHAHPA